MYFLLIQNAWGFAVTARAVVEEVKVELPWMLDLAKLCGLFAGKCVGALIRGGRESLENEDKEVQKWLESEFLEEGLEFDDTVLAKEAKGLFSFLCCVVVGVGVCLFLLKKIKI